MSKYQTSIPVRKKAETEEEKPKSSDTCNSCGWNFTAHVVEKMAHDHSKTRVVTRDCVAIAIRRDGAVQSIFTRCGDCYERELYASGKHRYSGFDPLAGWHKQSIDQGARLMESKR